MVAVIASAALVGLGSGALGAGFSYRSAITIDRTKVGNSGAQPTLSNFPMLFDITAATFKSAGNGGRVQSMSGYDIVFRATDTTTCAGTAPCGLDHELEKYEATTGHVVAWVRVPSLNTQTASTDTVVYVYYGDSSITSSSARETGVWDSNFKGVWHLNASNYDDSTANANNGTNLGTTSTTGKIAGAVALSGGADSNVSVKIGTPPSLAITGAMTVSTWVYFNAFSNLARLMTKEGSPGNRGWNITNEGLADSLSFGIAPDASGERRTPTPTVHTLQTGSWYYVVGVYEPSTAISLYLNGTIEAVNSTGIPASQFNGTANMLLGDRDNCPCELYGLLDETRIQTTVRDAHWIRTEYNNQRYANKIDFPADGFVTMGSEESGTTAELDAGALDAAAPDAGGTVGDTGSESLDSPAERAADMDSTVNLAVECGCRLGAGAAPLPGLPVVLIVLLALMLDGRPARFW